MNTEIGLLIVGAAAGGFVQGVSGFAFGMTALSFWAWGLEPGLVTVMAVFGGLFGQLFSIATLPRRIPLAQLLPFVAGGFIGIPLGTVLLAGVDPVLFRGVLGGLLLVYCPLMLFSARIPRITGGGRIAETAAGIAGGFVCGVGGIPGIASSLWCTLRAYDKDLARTLIQTFNLTVLAATFAAQIAGGLVTRDMLPQFAIVALALVLPATVGARVFAGLNQAAFRRLVLCLLFLSGAAMLVAALRPLAATPFA